MEFFLKNATDLQESSLKFKAYDDFFMEGQLSLTNHDKPLMPVILPPSQPDKTAVKVINVAKNGSNFKESTHVTPEEVAQALVISEDCDIYNEGKFLFGIRYNAVDVTNEKMKTISKLATSSFYRGPAAGPLDLSKVKFKDPSRQIVKVGVNGYRFKDNKKSRIRNNQHHTSTLGRTKYNPSLDDEKTEKLNVVKSELIEMSNGFKKHWNTRYQDYVNTIFQHGMQPLFLDNSVFSSLAVNTHEIKVTGETSKNSRAAIHTDPHSTHSVELMLTLKNNIEGGGLFFVSMVSMAFFLSWVTKIFDVFSQDSSKACCH